MEDPRGVSHANECLARTYWAMEDEERSHRHRHASLEQCRLRGDLYNHGRV